MCSTKYIIAFCMLAICAQGFAQQRIKKIGPIRLGMRYAALIDTLQIPRWSFADPSFEPISEGDLQQPKRNYRLYYDKDISPDTLGLYRKCSHAVVIILERVVVPGTALQLKNVHLSFYRDSLVEVRIHDPSPELITLIKRRFGKGADKKEEIPIACPYPYGGYTRKETLTMTAWADPEGATLNYMSFRGVTKRCEPKTISYVQFYSNTGLAALNHCADVPE